MEQVASPLQSTLPLAFVIEAGVIVFNARLTMLNLP